MSALVRELVNLVIQLLVALLIWRYYRQRTHPVGERYATFWPRFWTGSVDACVLWPVGFVSTVLLASGASMALGTGLIVGENLVWLFYTVVMHAKYGQTCGKMVCKVRVVDFKTEGPISYRQALLREGIPIAVSLGVVGYELHAITTAPGEAGHPPAFWLLAALPLLWFFAEGATMLTNEKRRALHDYIAGTVVVRTNTNPKKTHES